MTAAEPGGAVAVQRTATNESLLVSAAFGGCCSAMPACFDEADYRTDESFPARWSDRARARMNSPKASSAFIRSHRP